ncbi:hypothetical protein L7F22_044264 [Adiantum nelumboides]|nr:hypothetical protein [Adiantum nelumboides]
MKLLTATNSTQLSGTIQALFQVGALFGGLMSGLTSDPLGRRTAIFIACVLVIIGSALQTGSTHVAMFIVARFITGMGIGNLVIIVPTWQSEVSNPHSRGLLVGMHGTFILIGYSLALWIGTAFSYVPNGDTQWRVPLALQVVPPLLLASGIYAIPESPRWLLQHGKEEAALHVCKKLRKNKNDPNDNFAIAEFAGIKAQWEYDRELDSTWLAIFRVKSYRRRAFIGFSALFLAQCTGTQVINNYGPSIYEMIGYGPKAQLFLSCGWISSGILSNFISALLMDKVGRVNMIRFGFAGTLVALIGTTVTLAIGTRTGNSGVLKAAVWFIYMHIATYGAGLDCPSYVYGVELWPNHLRGKGAAISVSGLFVGALIVLTAASTAFAQIQWKYYIVFTVMTTIGVIISFLYFPDVNGMSLEEAARAFGDHVEERENVFNSLSDVEPIKDD